jgi:hypothetical protein
MSLKVNSADVATAMLSLTLNKILDYIEEPCNRLDFDDFERGESAMAAAVFWIINENLGTGAVYGAE